MRPLFRFHPIGPDNGFRMRDYWVWCPSVIRGDDGKYHMFASRWPKWLPFHPGWMTDSEVVRAVSERPEGPYDFAGIVLPARGPEYWDGCSTHNPSICRHCGKYYLFYTGITHSLRPLRPGDFLSLDDPITFVARGNKRVGVAWADSPEGPWQRLDHPILQAEPDTFYSFLTSNPAPWIGRDGQVALAFKARARCGGGFGPMTIGLAMAPRPEGPYRVASKGPLFDGIGEIEDPFLWKNGAGFHLLAKDMTGEITGQPGAGLHAISPDALDWRLGNPALAFGKEIAMASGRIERFGNLERPFLLIQDGEITHLCVAASDARTSFLDVAETRNLVLPIRGISPSLAHES